MAELATAGSVVGIISLGISCCEGLTRYYSEFKSRSDEVNNLISNIDDLRVICRSIDHELQKRIQLQENTAQQALRLIAKCLDNVKHLEDALTKCRITPLPQAFADRLAVLRVKALYPFRKKTLPALKEAVDDVLKNLGSALQILQL